MKYFFTSILLIFFLSGYSQSNISLSPQIIQIFEENGEMHFSVQLVDREMISKISALVSIDDVRGIEVFAYANENEFSQFLTLGLPYQVIIDPIVDESAFKMLDHINLDEISEWDFYPTYEAYLEMMNQFATDYPDLCQVFSIGKSVNGRDLMMAKISDNVGTREAEPQFLYTGTMHGDELAGYVLFLRLIDYLLSNYGTDPKVTNLVNSLEIWINPLANPDGTFAGGNHTVMSSTRNNANGVNLNRNYPDPEDGPHPDGQVWQPETISFMQLAEDNDFVMSANTHGGAEVINYPWDTWIRRAADDEWWIYVCREYVDTVHLYSPASYMDYLNNGITNGYDWYTIAGGRQDYMNYFHYCREVTMELSNTKKLPASQLEDHWDWNYRSLLNYMEQSTYGVSGVVTDLFTGEPLPAKVYIDGHDEDNSFVVASNFGFYQRLLNEGTYDITFSVPGYFPVTIDNVSVSKYTTVELNVQLDPGELTAGFTTSATEISRNSKVDFYDGSFGNPIEWYWYFDGGTPSESFEQNPAQIHYSNDGSFDVSLTVFNAQGDSSVLVKKNYIEVLPGYLMHDGTLEICNGLFYDSGGSDGNYQNNENYTLICNPGVSGAKISVDFEEFDLEYHTYCNYDWLKIYDGPTTSSLLIGTYCGTNSPGHVIATNQDGSLTFQFHSDSYDTRPGWKARISCRMEQTVILNSGWNGISSFVQPDDPELETVFEAIMDELMILQTGSEVFWPEQNINTLKTWESDIGYQIKLNDAAQLNLNGTIGTDKAFELQVGWNLLPVISPCPVDIEVLLSGSGEDIILVMEVAGTGIYWPYMGINTLEELVPGNSYLLKSTGTGTIVFPDCE